MPDVIRVDFEWSQFPDYSFVEPQPEPMKTAAHGYREASLVGRGNPLTIRPLDRFSDLYLQLANSDRSDHSHKEFAKKFGLLVNREREPSSVWESGVDDMRRLIELVKDNGNWGIENGKYVRREFLRSYSLQYGPEDESGEFTLSVVPANLYAALVLQCVSSRAGGAMVRSCKACRVLFQFGGASRRRSHRTFCSDKCRYEFNHRKRRDKQ